jgi:hypothetical protein
VYEFDWLDVTKVGLGEVAMGAVTQPAFAFFLRDGRVIRAQATPGRSKQRQVVVDSISVLAPPSVEFLRGDRKVPGQPGPEQGIRS